jgi:hypothetical protein
VIANIVRILWFFISFFDAVVAPLVPRTALLLGKILYAIIMVHLTAFAIGTIFDFLYIVLAVSLTGLVLWLGAASVGK